MKEVIRRNDTELRWVNEIKIANIDDAGAETKRSIT